MSIPQQKSIEELVEFLSQLNALEMTKLRKTLEVKWDVKAAAPMMMAPQAAAPAAEAAVESTEFEVSLVAVDPAKKMSVIKVVRETVGCGLKESKEFVESVTPTTPKAIKESCSKQEADEICAKFKDSGGEIKVKGL